MTEETEEQESRDFQTPPRKASVTSCTRSRGIAKMADVGEGVYFDDANSERKSRGFSRGELTRCCEDSILFMF